MRRPNPNAVTAGSGPSVEKPVLVEAMNLTTRALEDRLRLYRNLVVAVSLVSVASLLTALVCWRAWPLAGLILVVPLIGGFVIIDSRRLARWRRRLLGMADDRKLDLALYHKAISQYKHLPMNTLQAMLCTLPAGNPTDATKAPAGGPPDCARKEPEEWRILAATGILTLALAGLAAALFWRSAWLLAVAAGFGIWFVYLRRK